MSLIGFYKCRLCLSNSEQYLCVFEKNVPEVVEKFCSVKIEKDDHLPSHCCQTCVEEVHYVNKICTRIIESDRILREQNTVLSDNDDDNNKDSEIKFDPEFESDHMEMCDTDLKDGLLDALENDKSIETALVKQEISENLLESLAVVYSDEESGKHIHENSKTLKIKITTESQKKHRKGRGRKAKTLAQERVSIRTFEESEDSESHDFDNQLESSKFKTCSICSAQITLSHFRVHMKNHSESSQICDICGQVLKNSQSLRCHVIRQHKSDGFACPECGKIFRYQYRMQVHRREEHGGEPTHVCEFCGKGFYLAKNLKRHVDRKHLKLRPFTCPYCNKNFSSNNAGKTHVRQHTGELPYKCAMCGQGYKQRVLLRNHFKNKHGVDLNAYERYNNDP